MPTSPLAASGDYEARDRIGLPHWYAMLNPLQDDGFGGIVCAKEEVNSFVLIPLISGHVSGPVIAFFGHGWLAS